MNDSMINQVNLSFFRKDEKERSSINSKQPLTTEQDNDNEHIKHEVKTSATFFSKEPVISTDLPTKGNHELQRILINSDNMFLPLEQGSVAYFVFRVYRESSNNKFIITNFDISSDWTLFAEKLWCFGSFSFRVFLGSTTSNSVATVRSNFTHDTFFGTTHVCGQLKEVSLTKFKPRFQDITKTRQFESFIPIDGIISDGETSILDKHKDKGLRIVPKPPKMKRGIPTLYFGGRVKMESIKNFILVAPCDMSTKLFVFGKVTHNEYVGEVYHPLSPIQAITLALPHFK